MKEILTKSVFSLALSIRFKFLFLKFKADSYIGFPVTNICLLSNPKSINSCFVLLSETNNSFGAKNRGSFLFL